MKPAHWLQLTHIILGKSLQSQGFFFFLSDSQQEVNWKGDNSWLFSPPIDPQIGEAHLNSCVSSIQFLNLAPLPTSSLVSEK